MVEKIKTCFKLKEGNKWYTLVTVEVHYALVGEPRTFYLIHLAVERGDESTLAISLFQSNKLSSLTEKVLLIKTDSTVVSTRCKDRAINLLECQLGCPLQWLTIKQTDIEASMQNEKLGLKKVQLHEKVIDKALIIM